MSLAFKTIKAGLLHALLSSKCRHEFTVWLGKEIPDSDMKSWRRVCVKCRIWETRIAKDEPEQHLSEGK